MLPNMSCAFFPLHLLREKYTISFEINCNWLNKFTKSQPENTPFLYTKDYDTRRKTRGCK